MPDGTYASCLEVKPNCLHLATKLELYPQIHSQGDILKEHVQDACRDICHRRYRNVS